MSVKKKGSISSSYELFVNIDDEPGAIAVISSLLFGKKISIKNIGIIHNREYADGVLRIEFYSEAARLSAKDTLDLFLLQSVIKLNGLFVVGNQDFAVTSSRLAIQRERCRFFHRNMDLFAVDHTHLVVPVTGKQKTKGQI